MSDIICANFTAVAHRCCRSQLLPLAVAKFLGGWAAGVMKDAKPEQVSELMSTLTRAQKGAKAAKGKKKKALGASQDKTRSSNQGERGGFIEDVGAFI